MKDTSTRWLVLGLLGLILSSGAAYAVSCQNNVPSSNPDSVYTDHGNGTVTDTRTRLMWKKCAEGLSGATCQNGSAQLFYWDDALAHAEASTFASYSDWRLPNVRELSSLVEECRQDPAINTNRFPNTPTWPQWSSSPRADRSDSAWVVGFDIGLHYADDRNFGGNHVRLVRGGHGDNDDGPRDCPLPDNDVVLISDWLVEGTTNTGRYDLAGETKSFAFPTTNGTVTAGRLDTTYTSTNPRTRATWVSECPGGPPLNQVVWGTNLCTSTAYEVTTIRWSDTEAQFTCQLQPNTRYYFNVRSANAWDAPTGNCNAANCPFYGVKTVE